MNHPKSKGSSQWDSGGSTKFSTCSSVVGSSTAGEIEGLASWLLPPTVDDILEYFLDNRGGRVPLHEHDIRRCNITAAIGDNEQGGDNGAFLFFMVGTAVSQARQ
jgi:hypothetical protein